MMFADVDAGVGWILASRYPPCESMFMIDNCAGYTVDEDGPMH
jgi:hypothetical protein